MQKPKEFFSVSIRMLPIRNIMQQNLSSIKSEDRSKLTVLLEAPGCTCSRSHRIVSELYWHLELAALFNVLGFCKQSVLQGYPNELTINCSVINNYGPTLYRQLGYSPVKQLLYPAAWLTFALGLNVIGMLLVDRFPRPKYMAFGVLGCMSTLIIEAALVANFIASKNTAALQACVAMFFLFQVFYGICLGKYSRIGSRDCLLTALSDTL